MNRPPLVEIRKGMYGLKQAGRITNDRLKQHLKTHGYVPCRYTPGLFTHTSRKISFALCVDDFGVKHTDKVDAQHLLTCIEKLYMCTTHWEGKLYLGMTLNWNYTKRWMEKSMPGYIGKLWTRFYGAKVAPKRVKAPHVWTTPPIWLEPATVNHTNRLIAAAFHTRQNPPPRNCRIPSVLCPMHQLHHPRYPRLHRNKHCRRNRTRRRNGRLPFIPAT